MLGIFNYQVPGRMPVAVKETTINTQPNQNILGGVLNLLGSFNNIGNLVGNLIQGIIGEPKSGVQSPSTLATFEAPNFVWPKDSDAANKPTNDWVHTWARTELPSNSLPHGPTTTAMIEGPQYVWPKGSDSANKPTND